MAYYPGQTLGRGDLNIFLVDQNDNPSNAAEITYALYWVDPNPPNVEVLIGDPNRIPVNPTVGEYFAALMIPPSATLGTYRIKWSFRQLVSSPIAVVVMEFTVAAQGTLTPISYSEGTKEMITHLRKLLRDQCVGGETEIEVDAGGERIIITLECLHEVLNVNAK